MLLSAGRLPSFLSALSARRAVQAPGRRAGAALSSMSANGELWLRSLPSVRLRGLEWCKRDCWAALISDATLGTWHLA